MSSPTPPQLRLLRQLPPGALRGHFWRRREGPRHGYVRGQNGAMKPGKLLLSADCLQVELDSVACGAALVPGQWAQAGAVLVGMHQERSPGPRLPAPEGPRCLVSQCRCWRKLTAASRIVAFLVLFLSTRSLFSQLLVHMPPS